jgi:hypothetical protein
MVGERGFEYFQLIFDLSLAVLCCSVLYRPSNAEGHFYRCFVWDVITNVITEISVPPLSLHYFQIVSNRAHRARRRLAVSFPNGFADDH